jgi:hypothetical protein
MQPHISCSRYRGVVRSHDGCLLQAEVVYRSEQGAHFALQRDVKMRGDPPVEVSYGQCLTRVVLLPGLQVLLPACDLTA